MTTVRLRDDLDALAAYRPGKAPGPGDGPRFKLSSNENPYPPLPSVAARIAELAGGVNRYPNMAGHTITARLAALHGVTAGQVVLGAGGVEIISQLMRATSGAGDEVVFAWRSFEAYPLLAVAAGARPVQVPLTEAHGHDFAAMRAAIGERTRLVIVCNPNNPTGTAAGRAELTEFVESVPPEVVVLIDEAYLQFNRDPDAPDGVELFGRHPNVVVARTFSKAYGLAGLRVGYALAAEPVAVAMRKVALPFGVTDLAQGAALASLDAGDELAGRVDELVAERDRLAGALAGQGWRIPPSQANFFWFPLGEHTGLGTEVFTRHGVVVRPFGGEGLRVCVGDDEANEALLAAAGELRDLTVRATGEAR